MKLRKPSASMAVSLVALTVSIGGGSAYAATALAPNSVRTANLHNGAVIASKVNSGFLKKIEAPGKTGATGKTGARGATGATGATGPAGAAAPVVTRKLLFEANAGTGATPIFSADGITLYGSCSAAGYVAVTAQATDATPGTLAYLLTSNVGTGSNASTSLKGTAVGPTGQNGGLFWYTDSSFGAASSNAAAPFSGSSVVLTSGYNNSTNQADGGSGASDSVNFNYESAGGTVVTGQFGSTDAGTNATSGNPGANLATCTVYGSTSTM